VPVSPQADDRLSILLARRSAGYAGGRYELRRRPRRPSASEPGDVTRLEAEAEWTLPIHLQSTFGRRAVVFDAQDLHHLSILAIGLIPIFPQDLHVEVQRGAVRVDLDARHLGPGLVDKCMHGDDLGLVRLNDIEDLPVISLQVLELAFFDLEFANNEKWLGYAVSFL